MQVTLADLAALLGGEVVGDAQIIIRGVAPLEQARPGDLTFVTSRKYLTRLAQSRATAVLIDRVLPVDRPAIRVLDPAQAFVMLLQHWFPLHHPSWHIDPRAVLASGVVLGEAVCIGPYVVIGQNVRLGDRVTVYPGTYIGEACDIGADSVLYANVSVYPGVSLGRGVIVHSGAVIGADGFGFTPQPDGSYRKIPQVGRVVIGDGVEIGANTCIDRATLGDTVIEAGVKLDNLVQVGHNASIGAHTVIAGQTAVGGSARVQSRVRMGGQVGIADHVTIGEGAAIGGQSGVASDVEADATMFGTPAISLVTFKRMQVYSLKLGELFQHVKQLQRRLEVLEDRETRA